jgi:hypothetical protein
MTRALLNSNGNFTCAECLNEIPSDEGYIEVFGGVAHQDGCPEDSPVRPNFVNVPLFPEA